MTKLILSVAENGDAAAVQYIFEPTGTEEPASCLERMRGALFLTGAAIKSAKVIDGDHQWIAPSDLLKSLNGPHQRH
jgi:hypothetical protein